MTFTNPQACAPPPRKNPPCIGVIGGLDPCGAAGLAADLRVLTACGARTCPMLSVSTVQNERGVQATHALPSTLLMQQLQTVHAQHPLRALKIGLIGNTEQAQAIATWLHSAAKRPLCVFDPVQCASACGALNDIREPQQLRPLLCSADWLTPNILEAEWLLGRPIPSLAAAQDAAQELAQRYTCDILLKGGHLTESPGSDIVATHNSVHVLEPLPHPAHHLPLRGSGCTLASALAHALACGQTGLTAVHTARKWLLNAWQNGTPTPHHNVISQLHPWPQQAATQTKLPLPRFMLIFDPMQHSHTALRAILKHAPPNSIILQIRPNAPAPSNILLRSIKPILNACRENHTPCIINNRTDHCYAAGADGVHLGESDLELPAARQLLGPHAIIGHTAPTLQAAQHAFQSQADYIGVGPFRPTASKSTGRPIMGLEGTQRIAHASKLPTYAIGSVEPQHIAALRQSDVHGVAVIGGVWNAADPQQAAQAYVHALGSPAKATT